MRGERIVNNDNIIITNSIAPINLLNMFWLTDNRRINYTETVKD